MKDENDLEQQIKIIGETLAAIHEIYDSPLTNKEKCQKISFLSRKMFEGISENEDEL